MLTSEETRSTCLSATLICIGLSLKSALGMAVSQTKGCIEFIIMRLRLGHQGFSGGLRSAVCVGEPVCSVAAVEEIIPRTLASLIETHESIVPQSDKKKISLQGGNAECPQNLINIMQACHGAHEDRTTHSHSSAVAFSERNCLQSKCFNLFHISCSSFSISFFCVIRPFARDLELNLM